MMNLSEKLKYCRTDSNLTQAQVADELHVSRKTISGWENGHSFPDTTSLVLLSDVYHVTVDDLLRDDRLLKHYTKVNNAHLASHKICQFTYYANIVLWLLSYVELFRPAGMHSILIPLLLLINLVVYLTHFSGWYYFKKIGRLLKATICFILIFMIHVVLDIIDANFLDYMSHSELHFLVGFIFGRFILIMLISISIETIVFFHPFNRSGSS
ncbi:helix-turn-helix domain-containing protein [Levilactobacillus brevis]|uniref:helix-turn-helix domain-containing protein n=1 Tax=Levilactobacillus brevis TaxID=1580 RepID=UPI0035A350EF